MAGLKQADRLMQFSSPVGKDVLLIETLEGVEAISRLFEFHAELLSEADTTIEPKALIGNKVTVGLTLNDAQGARWINGIVASFEQLSGDSDFNVFRARIVPSMWQLTLTSNSRVFQNMTVLEIGKKILSEYGLSVSDQTSYSYKPLDYCTQYSESDFHFVSRIFEENGVSYWFEHSDQDNKIVLGDSRNAYQDCALSAAVAYSASDFGQEGTYGSEIIELSTIATMVSGKHSTRDYDYRPVKAHDAAGKSSASDYGKNGFEHFFYPAGEEGYVKEMNKQVSSPDHGSLFLETRALSSDVEAEIYRGNTNARSFCAGYTFTISKHPRSAWNRKYLLTSVTHDVRQAPSYRSHGEDRNEGYGNRFTGVISDIIFKPQQTMVKPRVYGPQTALVVSPSGEEMYIDKLGRVCVQFFWDRTRTVNTIDNTWVRVAQSWAGNGWGTYFWPRLNDEVVVAFLDGDPDNPVVVGSVYSGVNVPKYPLPDYSTRSGILTRSSKGGGTANANELRFEDKSGSEQIFLNAERDMDHRVEHDHRVYVGGRNSLMVQKEQYEQIGTDHHVSVTQNSVLKIGQKADIHIGQGLQEKIGGNYSLQVGQNNGEKIGEAYSMDAGTNIYLKAGMNVVIEAGMSLTLKGAGGFITIGPAGVAISGSMVLINSGGAAIPGSAAHITDPGDPTKPDEADDGTKGGAMGGS